MISAPCYTEPTKTLGAYSWRFSFFPRCKLLLKFRDPIDRDRMIDLAMSVWKVNPTSKNKRVLIVRCRVAQWISSSGTHDGTKFWRARRENSLPEQPHLVPTKSLIRDARQTPAVYQQANNAAARQYEMVDAGVRPKMAGFADCRSMLQCTCGDTLRLRRLATRRFTFRGISHSPSNMF